MFGADLGIVLIYSAVIMLIFMFSWILIVPFKLMSKFIVNVVLGIACIMLYNLAAVYSSIELVGINYLTALIVGALGIPGFVAIVVIQMIL